MNVSISGYRYYRTVEVCRLAGTAKKSYLRRLREGLSTELAFGDQRGWRANTVRT